MTPKPTPQKNPNTALIAGGIVLFVLLLGGLVWYLLSSDSTPSPTPSPTPPSPPSTEDEGSGDDVIDDDDDDDGTQTNDKKVNCKKAFKKNCSSLTSPRQKAICCYQQREDGSCTLKSCGIEPVTTDGYCCADTKVTPTSDSSYQGTLATCALNTSSNDCNKEKPTCKWSTTSCPPATSSDSDDGACCTNERNPDYNCGILDQSNCTDTYSGNKSGCKWYGSGCEGKAWCIPRKGEGTGDQNEAAKCMSLTTSDTCEANTNCQWGKNYVPTNGGSCVVNDSVEAKSLTCGTGSKLWPGDLTSEDGCKAIDNKKDCKSPTHSNGEKCCKWKPN